MAAAQTCVAPTTNVFDVSAAANCSAVTTCAATLATCQKSATCNTVSSCYGDYVSCLTAVSSYRTNTSSPCYAAGNAVYLAQLLASASSSMNGTALQLSCGYLLCQLQNASSLACGTNLTSAVCTSARLLPSTTSAPLTTNPGQNTVAVTVTIRISGANWTLVLADPVKKASAVAALLADLAALLGIDVQFLFISGLVAGSLTVNLSIYAGSGKTADALINSANSASGSSAWMTNTKNVYATVGSDALTTLSVSAATAAPGGSTTTGVSGSTTAAPGSSAVGAAGVWAVAAVAAVAALLA